MAKMTTTMFGVISGGIVSSFTRRARRRGGM